MWVGAREWLRPHFHKEKNGVLSIPPSFFPKDNKKPPANQCSDVWDIAKELVRYLLSKCFVLLHTK